jgi:vancomycin resistance protein YoaR
VTVNTPLRWTLLAVSTVLLLAVGGFGLSRVIAGEAVLGRVEILGEEVGGLSPSELEDAIADAAADMTARVATFAVAGQTVPLDPAQVGLEFDVETMARDALDVGRRGSVSDQFISWLGRLGDTVEIAPRASLDGESVEAVLALWDDVYIENPPTAGGIAVEGSTVMPVYPEDGDQIDRQVSPSIILDTLTTSTLRDAPVDLPIVTVASDIDTADVDAAAATANLWLSAPVTLTAETGEVSITFSVSDLATALVTHASDGSLHLAFDPQLIGPVLTENAAGLELPPVDARFDPDGVDIRIVPGRNGTIIDAEATTSELARAAASAGRRGVLPFQDGAEPEVTTADLEALGIIRLVSQFTTYHDCCQNRVENIHLIADTIDGAIVPVGEEFSLNDRVGERTVEAGYLEDGSIVGGEIVATVGGGVSQFATTFYNTVFWGGYADVSHRPHSYYFSRYPEGIEATISWPQPELTFLNDSDAAVYIATSYTDTSITVSFYGDNDGRTLIAAWPDGGPLDLDVVSDGGSGARRVEASVSERSGFTEPKTEYRAEPSIAVDDERTVQSGREGWSVTVRRTITIGDGAPTEDSWTVVYRPRPKIIEVHPCNMPDTDEECPEPTTTTTTTTTDSTVPPETTTSVAADSDSSEETD